MLILLIPNSLMIYFIQSMFFFIFFLYFSLLSTVYLNFFIHLMCITQLGFLSSFFYVYFFSLFITNFFFIIFYLFIFSFTLCHFLSFSLSLFLSFFIIFYYLYSLSLYLLPLKENPFILLQSLILSFLHFLFQSFFLFLSILTFCLLFFSLFFNLQAGVFSYPSCIYFLSLFPVVSIAFCFLCFCKSF